MIAFIALYKPLIQDLDPNNLPIGKAGTLEISQYGWTDLRTGEASGVSKIAEAAKGKTFVFLGEQHATPPDQQEEANVITALLKAGRTVTVGFEMFTRPKQDVLDQWSTGKLSETEFLEASDWKHQWGFDYSFYRPVFEVVRQNHLPAVALNIPREWVHSVATSGFAGLPTSARLQLPEALRLDNKDHRSVFKSLMGGHGATGSGMEGMYAAQVLWDEGMADTALKYEALRPHTKQDVFVVIAGSGHIMYGQGINFRLKQRSRQDVLNVVMLSDIPPISVSKGLADFVLTSSPKASAQ